MEGQCGLREGADAMTASLVMGLQWGDEGKGRVVDWIAREADAVVRFNGGPNAGHTIPLPDGGKTAVHQLPSCISNSMATLCLGNGMVIDIRKLAKEIHDTGVDTHRIVIDPRAQAIAPCHVTEDGEAETSRGGEAIGTTKTGNGPAYADKYARAGVTIGDLLASASRASAVRRLCDGRPRSDVYHAKWAGDMADMLTELCGNGVRIESVSRILMGVSPKARILFEAAHGWCLDIDHGDYPFVTSSSCGLAGVGSGAGFSPKEIQHVIGVIKPYSTRIGSGPFVPAFSEEDSSWIREMGGEYGVTTGRARRIGILDLSRLVNACIINSVDRLAMTHLDIAMRLDMVPYVGLDGEVARVPWSELSLLIEDATGASVQYISDGPQHQCMQQHYGEAGSDASIWRV